ncbi:hypothetical protein TNCV_2119511 [Trichonephila clavipes]|nr:hypothetical protein TNCV_2119511 [Trichonephila clavipes]
MHHRARCKNLLFLEDIKKVKNSCLIPNELKPRFVKNVGTLSKATAPFKSQSTPDSAITLEDSTEQNMNTLALCTTARHRQPPAFLKDYIRN